MKAIETKYKGYRFRSRLEARWAVFFDSVGTCWEYEPEGFDLGSSGWYLPDFFLPDVRKGVWVEIKPDRKEEEKYDLFYKMAKLAVETGNESIVFCGEPALICTGVDGRYADPSTDKFYAMHGTAWEGQVDFPFLPCVCPWCGRFGLEYDGRGARVCNDHDGGCGGYRSFQSEREALDAANNYASLIGINKPHWRADDKCYSNFYPQITKAALSARQARFEHGESGAAA